MRALILALVGLLTLPTAALNISPLTTRRSAVIGAAGLVLPPLGVAHAEEAALGYTPPPAYEDAGIAAIAARNAAATAEAKAAKAQAAADKAAVEEVAGGALNVALTGGIVLLLGAAGTFASSIFGQANEVTAFNLDRNRLASDAERRAMGLDKK